MTSTFRPSPLLSFALVADAASSGASALLMVFGAGLLSPLLGLPPTLLTWAGAILVPFAGGVAWLASRAAVPRAGVWVVIVLNVLWTVDCLLLLVSGAIQPTALGYAFVLAQAVVVAGLADVQYLGLRRAGADAGRRPVPIEA
jgi:hypothetical protein